MLADLRRTLDEIANLDPDRTALVAQERVLTYGEFRAFVAHIQELLEASGLAPGQRVALFLPVSFAGHASVVASALIGLTYIPLPVDDPDSRIAALIASVDPHAILLRPQDAHLLATTHPAKQILITEEFVFSRPLKCVDRSDAWPLYMLFTSGSTGLPKAVQIEERGVANFLKWSIQHLELTARDRLLAHSRLTFDLSVLNLYAPLLCGASVCLAESEAERMFPGPLIANGVTIVLIVPRITGLMLEAGQLTPGVFPKLRHVLFCGEMLLARQIEAWRLTNSALTVHNIYGPTEITVVSTCHTIPPNETCRDPVPVGRAFANMRCDFLNREGAVVDGATEGDLVISGIQVPRFGYWNHASDRYFEHPQLGRSFRTGDLVRRDAEGLLYWRNRLDDQIKLKGHRIELGEIEFVLSQHPALHDVAVIYRSSEEALAVYFSQDPRVPDVHEDLRDACRRMLPQVMRPGIFIRLASLPRNANGKVNRRILAEAQ